MDMSPATSPARRRCLLGLAALACFASAGVSAQGKGPVRSIDVAQTDDGYVATVVMAAAVPLSIAWDVLTDFDNMAKWVPNLKESKIVSRDGNVMTVEQKGTARFGLLSFPYTSVRKMQLDPQKTIQATQVSGNMKRLMSLMKVSADGTGTRLDYRLELVPSSIASAVLSPDFLKSEITEQFTAIVAEMVRRSK
ncbi:MAG TPA: SRPBCC family protein [Burkholderiales bacterium]|nr:SRPBCC family protein [Burkholderiales bacterium]